MNVLRDPSPSRMNPAFRWAHRGTMQEPHLVESVAFSGKTPDLARSARVTGKAALCLQTFLT